MSATVKRLPEAVAASDGALTADAIVLDRRCSGAEAFRAIVSNCLAHLLANADAARDGNAEAVHQMRVAIRRLRATLVLFEAHLDQQAVTPFEQALRETGRVFGAARDLDVFCLEILPDACPADAAGARELLDAAAAQRVLAQERLLEELGSARFTGLVHDLGAWSCSEAILADPALAKPAGRMASQWLERLSGKVHRRGRHILELSDDERHRLRKSLKKLRYGIDFLQTLFPRKRVKHVLHACKALQQALGDINDVVTATDLAERLGGRPAPAVLSRHLERERADALGRLPKAWKDFKGSKGLLF